MGRKTQKKVKQKGGMSINGLEEELSGLFKTLPPNKRAELTKVVEKLFKVSSNFASDPTTPAKQWEEFKEIASLVEKVQEIESGYSMCRQLPERRNAIKPFQAWLTDLGATIKKVEVSDFGEQGLGLRVTEEVEEGEEVIRIPQKAMMSVETARHSSIAFLVEKDPLLKTMPNVVLSIHLLVEKNSPASLWEPYINILPHSYNTVLYFTPAQLEGLRGSPVLEDALKQYKFVARQYAYFYRLFSNNMLKDYVTFDEYRWAVSTVMTRQNMIPSQVEGQKDINTLIPFWDLANHDQGKISTDYDPSSSSSVCYAQRKFTAGEQLTIFYGIRANCDLFIHNGFVFPDNQEDCLTLRLGIAKTDPLASSRLQLLEKLAISSQRFYLRRTAEPVDGRLMGFLRVLQLDAQQIKEYLEAESCSQLVDIDERLSVDAKVMQYMITRAALLLRAYPTTLEQDQDTLKESKDEIDRMTCQLRLCEKRILVNCVAYCETILQSIQNKQ